MSLVNSSKKTYNSSIAILTALTIFSGIATIFFGFLVVPFASAFYAMLLFCEKYGNRRMFSYISAVVIIALGFFFGVSSILCTVAAVLVGFLIYFMYSHKVGKLETVFIISGILLAFYIASIFVLIFACIDKATMSSIKDTLLHTYDSAKNIIMYSIMYSCDNVAVAKLLAIFDIDTSTQYFKELVLERYRMFVFLLPSYLFAAAIISVGVTSKIFKFFVSRFTPDAQNSMKWRLHTPTLFAVIYIASSILSLFTGDGVFGISVRWIYIIFSVIYAYIGVRFVYQFISLKKNSLLAAVVVAVAFLLLGTFAYQLTSYFGAYYVISVNKRANANRQS